MSENVKNGFIVILITVGLGLFLAIALYFYQNSSSGPVSGVGERIALCNGNKGRDLHWRLYTGSPPSPNTKWHIFSIDDSLCHDINGRMNAFKIDQKMIKKSGCTAGDYALYCRANARPEKHPRYDEIMNP